MRMEGRYTVEDKQELEETAMQIILHSGDARAKADEAMAAAKRGDFEAADVALNEAVERIAQAHRSQTDIIQKEAGGHSYPYSILFAHAQDTMMTIDLEIRLTRNMVDIVRIAKGEDVHA